MGSDGFGIGNVESSQGDWDLHDLDEKDGGTHPEYMHGVLTVFPIRHVRSGLVGGWALTVSKDPCVSRRRHSDPTNALFGMRLGVL